MKLLKNSKDLMLFFTKNKHINRVKQTKRTDSIITEIYNDILVEERKIKVDENNKEVFFKQTDLLVDSCVSLLIFPKTIKPKSCLQSIFCFV